MMLGSSWMAAFEVSMAAQAKADRGPPPRGCRNAELDPWRDRATAEESASPTTSIVRHRDNTLPYPTLDDRDVGTHSKCQRR
jgi:hypothetical protein